MLSVWCYLCVVCVSYCFPFGVIFVFHVAFLLVLSLCCLCFIMLSVWCYFRVSYSFWCYLGVVCVSYRFLFGVIFLLFVFRNAFRLVLSLSV